MAGWVRRIVELLAAAVIVGVVAWGLSASWVPVRVGGMSMSPALVAGDLALVRRDVPVTPGAVVLAREEGHAAVLHRVRAVNADGSLVMRGDANPVDDIEPVPRAAVRGTVEAVIPVGRLIGRWRHAPPVR